MLSQNEYKKTNGRQTPIFHRHVPTTRPVPFLAYAHAYASATGSNIALCGASMAGHFMFIARGARDQPTASRSAHISTRTPRRATQHRASFPSALRGARLFEPGRRASQPPSNASVVESDPVRRTRRAELRAPAPSVMLGLMLKVEIVFSGRKTVSCPHTAVGGGRAGLSRRARF